MQIDKRQLHTFVASTAKQFGYQSRVTLNNKTKYNCFVSATVHSEEGTLLAQADRLTLVSRKDAAFFDLRKLERYLNISRGSTNTIFTFSLVPEQMMDGPEEVGVEKKDIFGYIGAQDHYIEHYIPSSGFSSGVLYQVGPMNSRLFSSSYSFLMQAPKVFISEDRNTFFSFLYVSPDENPPVPKVARLECKLRSETGSDVLYWQEPIPRGGVAYVDIKHALSRHGIDFRTATNRHGFLHFEAFCGEASFVALTMNMNTRHNTFDLEHSLPPVYYNLGIGGEKRLHLVEYYKENFSVPQ